MSYEHNTNAPLIYTPKASQMPPVTPPKYELQKDITGTPKKTLTIEVKILNKSTGMIDKKLVAVPHLPKNTCKVCHGRGYFGIDLKSTKILFCHKCYK